LDLLLIATAFGLGWPVVFLPPIPLTAYEDDIQGEERVFLLRLKGRYQQHR
jgi:hypothetical protein